MKKLFFIALVLLVSTLSISAQTTVKGYYRKDGTYVNPHVRSSRNSTNHDNWSTRGNSNPYTGSNGSVAKDYSSGALNYGSGSNIYTGPQGGQYYNNRNGNKTYVPKRTNNGSTYNYNYNTGRRR